MPPPLIKKVAKKSGKSKKTVEKYWTQAKEAAGKTYRKSDGERYYGTAMKIFKAKAKKHLGVTVGEDLSEKAIRPTALDKNALKRHHRFAKKVYDLAAKHTKNFQGWSKAKQVRFWVAVASAGIGGGKVSPRQAVAAAIETCKHLKESEFEVDDDLLLELKLREVPKHLWHLYYGKGDVERMGVKTAVRKAGAKGKEAAGKVKGFVRRKKRQFGGLPPWKKAAVVAGSPLALAAAPLVVGIKGAVKSGKHYGGAAVRMAKKQFAKGTLTGKIKGVAAAAAVVPASFPVGQALDILGTVKRLKEMLQKPMVAMGIPKWLAPLIALAAGTLAGSPLSITTLLALAGKLGAWAVAPGLGQVEALVTVAGSIAAWQPVRYIGKGLGYIWRMSKGAVKKHLRLETAYTAVDRILTEGMKPAEAAHLLVAAQV